MTLRGNLFIKIFFGFWLVTTAILGSWMLSSQYFDSRPENRAENFQREGQRHPGPPRRFVLRTLYNLQHLPEEELRELLVRIKREHNIDIYLLQVDGSDLYAREVPNAVAGTAAQLRPGRRRALADISGEHFLAHTIHRQPVGQLNAVFAFPKSTTGLLQALGGNLWLRISLAVVISGLVCFGLSRLMTNRLKKLQSASRRLAGGALDTRIKVRDRGGDETDELARDFNSMAAQLQQRIDAQRRLLGDVSHELRSPLARLRVALALAEDDPQNLLTHLRRIEHETERLDELIEQLLSSQTTNITLDTHIDLAQLLRQLGADANFEGQTMHKQVSFDSDIEQAVVASSADLLHKSFDNILRNALRHTDENTRVSIHLRQQGEYFLVTVEDQGPGVPDEELAHIFGEFYRVDTARTRESGGYGLGLAIARRAIERHGGKINASNTGHGLLLSVSLPAEQDSH